ncbi:MAG TPA: NADH-quinone oxidoreductase subunit A [Bacillota bacterium]|nr:NADH-quinone oxidoreductase subunit A [Bacillota bacterium]
MIKSTKSVQDFQDGGFPTMASPYAAVAVYLGLAAVVTVIVSIVASLFGRKRPTAAKLEPYECGIVPDTRTPPRFSVRFYMIAMLFVIFDVEAASFYPWAVLLRTLRGQGLLDMAVFALVLAVGYAYVWKKGGLQWQ